MRRGGKGEEEEEGGDVKGKSKQMRGSGRSRGEGRRRSIMT